MEFVRGTVVLAVWFEFHAKTHLHYAFCVPLHNIIDFCITDFYVLNFRMSFFKPVENASLITNEVAALQDYVPNSIIYVILYIIALPPNILLGKFLRHANHFNLNFLAYLGLKPGLVNSRVRVPTTGMTLANLFGLFGFLILNFVYLVAVFNEVSVCLKSTVINYAFSTRCHCSLPPCYGPFFTTPLTLVCFFKFDNFLCKLL